MKISILSLPPPALKYGKQYSIIFNSRPLLEIYLKFWKISQNIHFNHISFNTSFCSGKSLENIKVQFEGLKMLKSPKLTWCYPFAEVIRGQRKRRLRKVHELIFNYISCSSFEFDAIGITENVQCDKHWLWNFRIRTVT